MDTIDRFMDGTPSIAQVLRPLQTDGWHERPLSPTERQMICGGYPVRCFQHEKHRFRVFSAVEYIAEDLDRLEYHLSISKQSEALGAVRCDGNEARWVLAQFGMDGVEEDNHVPHGVVRNYWRPVADNLIGLECPCKEEELAVAEDSGDYVWRGVRDV